MMGQNMIVEDIRRLFCSTTSGMPIAVLTTEEVGGNPGGVVLVDREARVTYVISVKAMAWKGEPNGDQGGSDSGA